MDTIMFEYLNLYCLISLSVVQEKSRKPLITVSDNEVARGENNKWSGLMIQSHLSKPQRKQDVSTHALLDRKNKNKVPRTKSREHSQERSNSGKDLHACTNYQQREIF